MPGFLLHSNSSFVSVWGETKAQAHPAPAKVPLYGLSDHLHPSPLRSQLPCNFHHLLLFHPSILMNSSSVQTWSRAGLCGWLCWSMAFMGLNKKPLTMTTHGTRCVSWTLGMIYSYILYSRVDGLDSSDSIGPDGLFIIWQEQDTLEARSRRTSHSQGTSQSCTFGTLHWKAAKSSPWKKSARPFPLG